MTGLHPYGETQELDRLRLGPAAALWVRGDFPDLPQGLSKKIEFDLLLANLALQFGNALTSSTNFRDRSRQSSLGRGQFLAALDFAAAQSELRSLISRRSAGAGWYFFEI